MCTEHKNYSKIFYTFQTPMTSLIKKIRFFFNWKYFWTDLHDFLRPMSLQTNAVPQQFIIEISPNIMYIMYICIHNTHTYIHLHTQCLKKTPLARIAQRQSAGYFLSRGPWFKSGSWLIHSFKLLSHTLYKSIYLLTVYSFIPNRQKSTLILITLLVGPYITFTFTLIYYIF